MKKLILFFALLSTFTVYSQITFQVTISPSIQKNVKSNGRIFICLNKNERAEPKDGFWPRPESKSIIFEKAISNWTPSQVLSLSSNDEWNSTIVKKMEELPKEKFRIQLIYAQSDESRIVVPGDLFSEALVFDLIKTNKINIVLDQVVPNRKITENKLVKEITQESQLLTNWWKRPVDVKASVLLPSTYFENTDQSFPVRYNIAGYGGRYDRINRLVNNPEFMTWWNSPEAPQVITVFLDGEGPFGDSYQLDSDNNGPYGQNLINELIPYIEQTFRTTKKRYTDGCSTGGWVSLALQLFYPETFDACFSYSPDPVDFHDMQLMNIYADENAFINEYQLEHPSNRNRDGEPVFTVREEINYENIQGRNNTYTTSGQQWGAWNAVFGSKSMDGTPKPLFDPISGKIDKSEAEKWKRYDLLSLLKDNWKDIGQKIQGKINVTMGDMDNFYLNNALRNLDTFLKGTEKPKSDANIIFKATEGHCDSYSHRKVLEQIGKL